MLTSPANVGRGELDRAQHLIDEAVQMSGLHDEVGRRVMPYYGLAKHFVALGDYEAAIDAAEKGLEVAEGTGHIPFIMYALLPILGEACLWAGHIDRAERVGERIREYAEKTDHRVGSALADACASAVQWRRGDATGAVKLMKASVDVLEASPMSWAATRIRRQLAGMLFDMGRRDEALQELDRVHTACLRMHASLELEKARAMYIEMGVTPPSIPNDGRALGLTKAELQVAILVAHGLTTKQLAGKTKRTTRTISTHLSNIYTKLGIGGAGARARLGNLVREAGLLE